MRTRKITLLATGLSSVLAALAIGNTQIVGFDAGTPVQFIVPPQVIAGQNATATVVMGGATSYNRYVDVQTSTPQNFSGEIGEIMVPAGQVTGSVTVTVSPNASGTVELHTATFSRVARVTLL
jgi:hypothetical protein